MASVVLLLMGVIVVLICGCCCCAIFIYVLKSKKREIGPALAVPGAGTTVLATPLAMPMTVVATPMTGGLNADQPEKQQASPGQPVSVVAIPQQAQKHSVAI